MLRSRRVFSAAAISAPLVAWSMLAARLQLPQRDCHNSIAAATAAPTCTARLGQRQSSLLESTAGTGFSAPVDVSARRHVLSAASGAVTEDSDVVVDGLDALASHAFQADSVLLVAIGWAAPETNSKTTSGISRTIVLVVSGANAAGATATFDIAAAAAAAPNSRTHETELAALRAAVSTFLVAAAATALTEHGAAVTTVVLLPFQKDATLAFLAAALALPRVGKLGFTLAANDAWTQVYQLYSEHRRKIRGVPLPTALDTAYAHLLGQAFRPVAAVAGATDSSGGGGAVAAAAFAAELALETVLLAVQRLAPPVRNVASAPVTKRQLIAFQACARVVRPVNFFVLRVDNKMAKSIRDKTAIRIELYNPQKQRQQRFDLTSLTDRKLQEFEAEVGFDFNSVTALFLTPDTEQSAAMSVLRAIKPKNPIFTLGVPALAAYIDGDDVVAAERFGDGFAFSNSPKSMWEQMASAVSTPTPLVRAIVGAAYHRLKLTKAFTYSAGGTVPAQAAWSVRSETSASSPVAANKKTGGAAAAVQSETTPDGRVVAVDRLDTREAVPRSAISGRASSESVKSHSRYRSMKSAKETDVENALVAWNEAIYGSKARTAREEAAAKSLERYLVVDLETTTESKYKRIANPFIGTNFVVLPGALDQTGKLWMPAKYLTKDSPVQLPDLAKYDVIVGHNLKFDLMYLWRLPQIVEFIARGGRVWDTMYAEYLLSGHATRLGTGAGLDDVAAGYGGSLRKMNEVKEAWAAGKQTYEIPYATLSKYLQGDLLNTDYIFKMQRRRALAQKQVISIQHRMDSLLCTTEMEFNGLPINVALARSHNEKLITESANLKRSMDSMIPAEVPASRRREFNWGSMQMMQCLYFGGALKFTAVPASASWRNENILLYSGLSGTDSTAHLAYMANNLTPRVVKTFVHPYLRTRGLRTTAALEEAFSDAEAERRFECFFYGVELDAECGSDAAAKAVEKNIDAQVAALAASRSVAPPPTDDTADAKINAAVPAAAKLHGLSGAAAKAAKGLFAWKGRNVKTISVVHLFSGVAFEGSVRASGPAATTSATDAARVVAVNDTGASYTLAVTRVSAASFAELASALNAWINDVLLATTPAPATAISAATTSDAASASSSPPPVQQRVALLFGRRNAELYEPLLQDLGFSVDTFEPAKGDAAAAARVATSVQLCDDAPIELCALRHMNDAALVTMYANKLARASAAVSSSSSAAKPAATDAVALLAAPTVGGAAVSAGTAVARQSAGADMFLREQLDGGFDGSVPALARAVLFGDRALRLAHLINSEYVRNRNMFLAEPSKCTAHIVRNRGTPKKALALKVVPGVDKKAAEFNMAAVPQSCYLDAPFATIPVSAAAATATPAASPKGGKKKGTSAATTTAAVATATLSSSSSATSVPMAARLAQARFLRVVGSQLRDEDAFAQRQDEVPPLDVHIPGKLQQFVASENERRVIVSKFTSPDTKKLQVGEDTLSYFAKLGDKPSKILLDLRQMEKQLSTYYEDKKSGMMSLVHSNDNCIHHELIHNKTTTGRLSSANPNCQNIPKEDKSEIRELFVSRFGPEKGVCIEADYSQLEVVTLCCLSKDKQMTDDLTKNVDFHCKRVAMMRPDLTYEDVLERAKHRKEPEFVKLRQQAKIFSFQRQYGAGVKMLSESTGLAPDVIRAIIAKEKETYAGCDLFYDMVSLSCHTFDPTLQTGARNSHGDNIYKGVFPVLTGSRFVFTQSDVPFEVQPGEPTTNYSPTHLKNYPVQGFAGEIVQIMLGQLYRHFVKNNNYGGRALLTNTVHDCVWIDARREVAKEVAADVTRIMSDARRVLNESWPEMGCEVEFPVDVVIGPNMGHVAPAKSFVP